MTEWQDISTAPRDGTLVRLKCEPHPEYGEARMIWESGRWEGLYFGAMGIVRTAWFALGDSAPTHWAPLEAPQ